MSLSLASPRLAPTIFRSVEHLALKLKRKQAPWGRTPVRPSTVGEIRHLQNVRGGPLRDQRKTDDPSSCAGRKRSGSCLYLTGQAGDQSGQERLAEPSSSRSLAVLPAGAVFQGGLG